MMGFKRGDRVHHTRNDLFATVTDVADDRVDVEYDLRNEHTGARFTGRFDRLWFKSNPSILIKSEAAIAA